MNKTILNAYLIKLLIKWQNKTAILCELTQQPYLEINNNYKYNYFVKKRR